MKVHVQVSRYRFLSLTVKIVSDETNETKPWSENDLDIGAP